MGTRTATGKLQIQATAEIKNTLSNGKVASASVGNTAFISQALTSGVQNKQINRAWEADFDIPINTNIELNLFTFGGKDIGAGTALDGLGQSMDLEEVVLVCIKHNGTDAGLPAGATLEIEPAAASGWTAIGSHTVANGGALKAGGVLLKFNPGEAGFDIQGGTAERIKLSAKLGAVNCTVVIFGRNDDDDSSSSSSTSSGSSSSSSVSSSSVSSSVSSSASSSSSS